MFRLTNVIQPYAWGSHTAIADLRGQRSPSPTPEAELWMGAHERGPSRVTTPDGATVSLLDWVHDQPEAILGASAHARFEGRFPFLLKVLAAAQPLSLQAHPSAAQARAGFDAEEQSGVPISAHNRNYKDRWHKPELVCALEPFEALCGFRPSSDALGLIVSLGVPALEPLAQTLRERGNKAAFDWIMRVAPGDRPQLVTATATACERHETQDAARRWVVRLAEQYPGDIGVVASLLLRYVRLEPLQALYLPAGNLHAYLQGTGIELMANSDNVLRGGLTVKHVDPSELERVLQFDDAPSPPLVATDLGDGVCVYETPAAEFRLYRVDVTADRITQPDFEGPEIVLCVEGEVEATSGNATVVLTRGASGLSRACDGPLTLTGAGRVFVATVGATRGRADPSPA